VSSIRDEARMKAADDQLDEAIREALAARGYDVGVVVDRFVCVALQHYDDDGGTISTIARIVPGEAIPHYRMLGMLDVVATLLRCDYMTDGGDE
jgi:hypothetical protein